MDKKKGADLPQEVDRRQVLVGAAALGVTATILTACGGRTMSKDDETTVKTELEIANERLVTDFCRDWSLRDVDALAPYLADDLYYQITPSQPLITSLEQFRKQMGPFLKNLESVEWEILRSHVIGPLVLNERIDHFNAPSGGKMPSMRFQIVGHFVVEEGKIQIWKDWPMPGKEQFIG